MSVLQKRLQEEKIQLLFRLSWIRNRTRECGPCERGALIEAAIVLWKQVERIDSRLEDIRLQLQEAASVS